MLKCNRFVLLTLLLFNYFNNYSIAQDSSQRSTKSKARQKSNPQVLDFEADVIEGEDQRPDLLVLVGDKKLDLDSFIYLRDNFHDFHLSDRKKKTGIVP